ncbi:hypothetical protein GGE65_007291 [Skermanella aerolata]|uniref:hypothetical protein n=1 Tax=Skermanella aerolata TaxID=393310 RepID=UPI003D1C4E3F
MAPEVSKGRFYDFGLIRFDRGIGIRAFGPPSTGWILLILGPEPRAGSHRFAELSCGQNLRTAKMGIAITAAALIETHPLRTGKSPRRWNEDLMCQSSCAKPSFKNGA